MGGISSAGHVSAGPRPVIVFNPTAWRRGDVVSATLWDVGAVDGFVVRTAEGATMPAQKVNGGHYWGHDFVDLVFPASAGALGYAAYAIDQGSCPEHAPAVKVNNSIYGNWGESMRTGAFGFSNEYLDVEFDTVTGGICKLVDKASGIDLADRSDPLGLVEYVLERPRGMTAWVIGDPQRRVCPIELTGLSLDHKGPHFAVVTAKMKVESSDVSVTYTLRAGQPRLDITVRTTWVERGGPAVGVPSLLMRFPMSLSEARATYEVPFGIIERPHNHGEEVPSLRFADVTGRSTAGKETAGCTILNDSKYGHSLDGSTLRVSLIRSSYEPDPLPEIGEHVIQLAIAPHAGGIAAAEMIKLGAAFNHPLQVTATDVHAGELPSLAAAVGECKPAGVIVTGVKKAEDDDAVIFRLLETSGKAAAAKVTLDAALFGKVASAIEVDFIEQPLPAGAAKAGGNGFSVTVPGSGIASVKVTFG